MRVCVRACEFLLEQDKSATGEWKFTIRVVQECGHLGRNSLCVKKTKPKLGKKGHDLCLFLLHEMTPVISSVFTLCVCLCTRFTFACPSYNCHKASVVVRKSNLCKHSRFGGGWPLRAYVERSPRAFLQFFFLCWFLEEDVTRVQTSHLNTCITWAILFVYPIATNIMQCHQGILRFETECHLIEYNIQGWVLKCNENGSWSVQLSTHQFRPSCCQNIVP